MEPHTPISTPQGGAALQRLFQLASQQQQGITNPQPPATPETPAAHSTQAMSDLIKNQLGLSTPQPPHPAFSLSSHPSSYFTPALAETRELPTMSPVSSPMKASLDNSAKPPRPEVEPGAALPSSEPRVEYVTGSAGRRVQLNVTPITIYKTEELYSLGQLVAVNSSFICYSVKGDMVRILATTNASLRSLLRGHTKPVHDLAFAPSLESDGASLLATTAADGQCMVWRITIKDKEITTDVVAKLTLDDGLYYTRAVWNPAHPLELVTLRSDSEVSFWNVSLNAGASCTRTVQPQSLALAIAFNNESIALGTRDGFVTLYSQTTGDIIQRWQPHGGKAVWFVNLRPGSIVTGTRKNREFRLWDLNTATLAHEFALTVSQPKTFANLAAFDSSGRFLFIANTKSPILYVLHVSASRFDYVAEFTVTYPILSFVMTTLQRPKPADAADEDPLPPPETLLWCLQTAAIQRYHINETQSAPRRILSAEALVLPPLGSVSIAARLSPSSPSLPASVAPVSAPLETAPPARTASPSSVPPVSTPLEAVKDPIAAILAPPAADPPAAASTAPSALTDGEVVRPVPLSNEANGRSTPATAEEEERDWQRKIEEARREQVAARHAEETAVLHTPELAPATAAASPSSPIPTPANLPTIAAPAAAEEASGKAPEDEAAIKAQEEEAALRIQSAFRSHLSRRASQDGQSTPLAAPSQPTVVAAAGSVPTAPHPVALAEKEEDALQPSAPSTSSGEPRTTQRTASGKKGFSERKKKAAATPAAAAAKPVSTAAAPVSILARPKQSPDATATAAPSSSASTSPPQPEPAAASSSVSGKRVSASSSSSSSSGEAKLAARPETVQLDKHAARTLSEQLAPLIAHSVQAAVAAELRAQLPAALRAHSASQPQAPQAAPALDKHEMRAVMQDAFAACFRETVLPAFERATQTMFAQMQAAFDHGLSENLRRMPIPPPAAAAPPVIPPEITRLHADNAQLQAALSQQLRSATDTLIHLGESLQQRLNEAPLVSSSHAGGKKGKQAESREAAAPAPAPVTPYSSSAVSASSTSGAAPVPMPSTPEKRRADRVSHTPAPVASLPPVAAHSAAQHSTAHNNAHAPPPDSAILAASRARAPSVPMAANAVALPAPLPLPQHPPPHIPAMRSFKDLFNYVLNANDVQMVTEVCARHDPTEVFAATNLSPMILLPLVQQLGSDLSRALPPKINWLRACLIRLEPRDPLLADVLPDVLMQLNATIEAQRVVERDPAASAALASLQQLVVSILQRV